MFPGTVSDVWYEPFGVSDYVYTAWLLKADDVRAFNTEEEARHMKMLLSL